MMTDTTSPDWLLVEAVKALGEITVVAPATPQSNVGHRVTMSEPIRVDRPDAQTYVVHATPADCTRLAVKQLVPDVDWIIAGINPGANLGSDVYQSGTVAAAREAAILGVRAMAVSQYIAPDWTVDWPAARAQVVPDACPAFKKPLHRGQFWNINLPSPITAGRCLPPNFVRWTNTPTAIDIPKPMAYTVTRGSSTTVPDRSGSDVDVCFGGMISVTLMEI
jgi:5'-nucleotidase